MWPCGVNLYINFVDRLRKQDLLQHVDLQVFETPNCLNRFNNALWTKTSNTVLALDYCNFKLPSLPSRFIWKHPMWPNTKRYTTTQPPTETCKQVPFKTLCTCRETHIAITSVTPKGGYIWSDFRFRSVVVLHLKFANKRYQHFVDYFLLYISGLSIASHCNAGYSLKETLNFL